MTDPAPATGKSRLIVSLTTIPPRARLIQPTIDAIRSQSVPPDAIELYIPEIYSRRGFTELAAEDLPDGCDIIRVATDHGPATKILPAARRHAGQDVRLVYCDDDRVYDRDWLKRLTDLSDRYPEDVVAERGLSLHRRLRRTYWNEHKVLHAVLRTVSLGLWHPLKKRDDAPDIAEGVGGVLIKPHFLDAAAFDIPDILWTVDDVWLSGHYQRLGHDLKLTRPMDERKADDGLRDNAAARYNAALTDLVHEGHDRNTANVACVRYMQRRYGVFRHSLAARLKYKLRQ